MKRLLSNRLILVFLCTLLVLSYCKINEPEKKQITEIETTFPKQTWERIEDIEAAGYSEQVLNNLRNYVESLQTTGLMVTVGGKVLFEYGNLTELSYIASSRKSLLSMLYGKYVKNGVIDLEKTIGDLGIDDVGGLLDIEKTAKVRHLISARSGVYHKASNPGTSDGVPPRGSKQPGEYFLYNNWDFNVAGFIFEQETGFGIYEAFNNDIAIPVGMRDYKISSQHKSGDAKLSKYPAYHFWLSVRDIARIGHLMLNKGNWDGNQIIPAEWVEESTALITPPENMNPQYWADAGFGYSYMWWIWAGPKTPNYLKGAYSARGAFGQFLEVIPELDMVIAHKCKVPPYNKDVRWDSFKRIMNYLNDAKIK